MYLHMQRLLDCKKKQHLWLKACWATAVLMDVIFSVYVRVVCFFLFSFKPWKKELHVYMDAFIGVWLINIPENLTVVST